MNQKKPLMDSILLEAYRTVRDRRLAYGPPADDFARTATIWSAILGIPVTPQQVALCLIGVKMSRECYQHKRDNCVDIAGYANVLEEIH